MNSKQKVWVYSLAAFSCFVTLLLLLFVFIFNTEIIWVRILVAIGILLFFFLTGVMLYFLIYNFARTRELVKKSFNGFIEEIMTNNNIGIIIYDIEYRIIWVSNFIKNKFGDNYIGFFISDFFQKIDPSKNDKFNLNLTKLQFKYKKNLYEAQFWPLSSTIVIHDITTEQTFKNEAWEQKAVIGEIEIDNLQLYQSILSEEQLFNINKIVIDVFKECSNKYNFIYRQYTNGKFIIFTNEVTLKDFEKTNFEIFTRISERVDNLDISKLSLSLGFARGWSSLKEKLEQAKKALVQSQSRGGDQVTIYSNNSQPIYYGSNTEILTDSSRTKIKNIALELEKKLLSTSISKVMIYGHANADLDSIGASYGIYEIAKAYGKNAYICNNTFDDTVKKLFEEKNNKLPKDIFIRNVNQANKMTDSSTLVVLVDNSDPFRTDNKEALTNVHPNNVFVFDHHRLGKSIDFASYSNIYVDTSASSAAEIVTEIAMFLDYRVNLSHEIAQVLLNGIYLDTNQFSKSVTTRAFEAAAFLEKHGAKGSISGEMLKIDEETQALIDQILKNVVEVKKGYFLTYTEQEASNDVISIAANEILKIRGRVASFVVAKLKGTKTYKLSARGVNTNVQIICEAVGGGGHFGTAAATSDEELEQFVDNIRTAIIDIGRKQNESNFN
ncbi:GGDEF domain-containing protein [Mycoplasmopsis gallinacea]|uniref:Putative bifunctional signaling protein/50S ribosomal protein L9 n=1 Tax=Mycoplasmopsis gallinacea TaxID=29556 RepID=A0A449A249_9BACT|nr:DHH family phosphoesterase [Mycoplasmopsis gallinacea]VEU58299.1 putative bifunctional signaling protein/50S ribosomal protein L9 [Mycoplasmopsis gallinacea]